MRSWQRSARLLWTRTHLHRIYLRLPPESRRALRPATGPFSIMWRIFPRSLDLTGDRLGNQSPLYFDACLKELYPTMMFGATTISGTEESVYVPVKLWNILNENHINTVCWVVSALTMISSMGTFDKVVPKYLHTVAFGSEVLPDQTVQSLETCASRGTVYESLRTD